MHEQLTKKLILDDIGRWLSATKKWWQKGEQTVEKVESENVGAPENRQKSNHFLKVIEPFYKSEPKILLPLAPSL